MNNLSINPNIIKHKPEDVIIIKGRSLGFTTHIKESEVLTHSELRQLSRKLAAENPYFQTVINNHYEKVVKS